MNLLKWKFTYPVTVLFALLLMADLGFALVHVVYKFNYISHPHFSIDRDGSYAEVYQYLKEFWIVCLLLLIAVREKAVIYLAWAFIFLYMLADDSMRIHEMVGGILTRSYQLQPVFGLRAQDIGELLITGLVAAVLFSFLFLAYYFASPTARRVTHYLLLLVAGIAFFGIVVDMLHVALPWGKSLFALIEDGGEMAIMSLVVGYCFSLLYRHSPALQANGVR